LGKKPVEAASHEHQSPFISAFFQTAFQKSPHHCTTIMGEKGKSITKKVKQPSKY